MPNFILAIDQGTTSTRAIVFDETGTARGSSQIEIGQHYPADGWVNHDAQEIWQSALTCMHQATADAGVKFDQIRAIGVTNQRETTIVWDRASGEPLGPAIVWQSRQSVPWVEAIRQRGKTARYREITGLVPDAYFSATKLAMLLDEDVELRKRAEFGEALFGTVDSWLLFKLTGGAVHATDCTNAARTMLFDLESGAWSDELLADLGIPAAMLPAVEMSSGDFGVTAAGILSTAVPIMGIAGDQHAALFGQACFERGHAKNTIGTGSFLLMNTDGSIVRSASGLLSTVAWGIADRLTYALEGAIFVTGSAVQWLRDGLGLIRRSSDIEELAGTVKDSGGLVFVPSLVGLGAPHWDPHARGTMFGISRATSAGHVARAALEAIALQTKDVLDAMTADSGLALGELKVDGGAAANDLLLQLHADLLGVTVLRPVELETTALGAAYLAGLGAGLWKSMDEIASSWKADKRFDPSMSGEARDTLVARWREAIARTRGWII
jgi:glycerol kinase